jgi:hypothetical protein
MLDKLLTSNILKFGRAISSETQVFQIHIHRDFFSSFHCGTILQNLAELSVYPIFEHLNKVTFNVQCAHKYISSTGMKTQHLAAAYNIRHEILILTYLRSWALLEKPPIVQLLKNFPAFYGTWRFIPMFTRALHWSLSSARSIQSIQVMKLLPYSNYNK